MIQPVLLPLLVALLLSAPVLLLVAPMTARAQSVDVGIGGVGVGGGDAGGGVSVGGISVGGSSGGSSSSGSSSSGGADAGERPGRGVSTTTPEPQAITGIEQELALDAVRSARALPLDQILVAARRHTSGEIIDARLIELRGFLLYELKVIEAGGDVADLYFYARSGTIVRTE